jgi:hypothetical protein
MKRFGFPPITAAAVATLLLSAPSLPAEEAYQPKLPMPVKVLVIKYFPVKGDLIDINQTGDWGASLTIAACGIPANRWSIGGSSSATSTTP